MNSNIKYIFSFVAGTAFGALVTWKYVQNKYEQIAQEEIDSVKKAFSQKAEKDNEQNETKKDILTDDLQNETKNKSDLKEYICKIKTNGYTNYADYFNDEKIEKYSEDEQIPYVIPPEDLGDDEDYECISFTYYADGFLTDDADMLVEDIPGTIGADFYEHFGEYEDDSVCVKNDRLKHYYEILSDPRNYKDVLKEKPYLLED